MTDKLMYIPNAVTQNYPCSARLVVETFDEHSTIKSTKFTKVPKVVKATNKKTL